MTLMQSLLEQRRATGRGPSDPKQVENRFAIERPNFILLTWGVMPVEMDSDWPGFEGSAEFKMIPVIYV